MPFYAGQRITHTVFADGRSDYVIVLGADASESEKWAAAELQYWLQECGSAKLELRTDQAPLHSHEIILGYNRHSRMLLGDSPSRRTMRMIRHYFLGPHLLIQGGRLLEPCMAFFSLGAGWAAVGIRRWSAWRRKDRWSL